MTAPLCKCGCDEPLVKHPYETLRQWEKRLASGYFRPKCKKNAPANPPRQPPPLGNPVSWCHEGGGKAQPKELPVRDTARLAYARAMPCCLCGSVEAVHGHHEAEVGKGTLAGKTSDRRVIPLCWRCHRLRHDKGREVYGSLDVEEVIRRINNAYDNHKGGREGQ